MTEFTVKKRLRINFVPFLTAGSFLQRTRSLTSRVALLANTRVNECHIFTDRVKNVPDETTP